jgi:hypothetical protein
VVLFIEGIVGLLASVLVDMPMLRDNDEHMVEVDWWAPLHDAMSCEG